MTKVTGGIILSIGAALCLSTELRGQARADRPSAVRGLTAAEAAALERQLETVREAGVVESSSIVEMHSEVPGEAVVTFVVPEGTFVKKGDALVRFDDTGLRQSIEQQQIVLQQAQAALESAKSDLESALQQAEIALPATELKVRAAELARSQYLDEGGALENELAAVERRIAIAKQRLELAEQPLEGKNAKATATLLLAVAEAKSDLEAAVTAKQFLTRHERGYRTAILDLALAEARMAHQEAQSAIASAKRVGEAELQVRQSQVAAAEAHLVDLKRQLEQCQIIAPRDGAVLYPEASGRRAATTIIEAGATVRQGQALLRIADFDRLHVRVRVHESRIGRVKVGQAASLKLDAYPMQAFRGKVTTINRTPEPAQWLSSGGAEYAVIVAVSEPPEDIRVGLSVLAEIDTAPLRAP